MTKLIQKEVTVRIKNPSGANYNPIRLGTKVVECFDIDYGIDRQVKQDKERAKKNQEWRSLSPEEQLKQLDKKFGKGKRASKQRLRIMKILSKKEKHRQ